MGKGRAPCCDKTKVKKGPWSPAEDMRLTSYIQIHGHSNWRALPKHAGLMRCGKSCRLRWINYLRPDVKRGNFTSHEEQIIIDLHNSLGNKWSKIASHLPGRTDNEIKNVWNTHIKKKLQADMAESKPSITSSDMELTTEESRFAESVIKKPMKDYSFVSGSPTSSYASNFTTYYEEGSDAFINPNDKIEIPFEPDIDYWELLDSMDQGRQRQQYSTGNQDSNFGEDHEFGSDYNQWLRLLETEVGLTSDVHTSRQSMEQYSIPITQQVLELEPGSNPDWNWFALGPSSSHIDI